MTDLTGQLQPGLAPLAPTTGPVYTNLPSATSRFQRKYTTLAPLLPPNLLQPLASFDQQRLLRGQSPLTDRETLAVLKALSTHTPATPQPHKSFFSSIVSDAGKAITGLAKLPMTLYHEGGELLNIVEAAKNLPHASNPIETLGNLATLPGARLLPGSYIASQFAPGGGGVRELQAHPLFTALDILPYAHKAAKMTPVVKAYEAQTLLANKANVAEVLARGDAPTLAEWKLPNRPIQTALTRKIGESGVVEPNTLGLAVDDALARARRTQLGQLTEETFSKLSRSQARMSNRFDRALADTIDPSRPLPFRGTPLEPLANMAREQAVFRRDLVTSIGKERASVLFDAADNPGPDIHSAIRSELDSRLTPVEQAHISRLRELRSNLATYAAEADLGRIIDGEFYTRATGDKILRARRYVNNLTRIRDLRSAVDEQLAPLRATSSTQPRTARLIAHIDNGNWTEALNDIKGLRARRKYVIDTDWDAIESSVTQMKQLAKNSKIPSGGVSAKKLKAKQDQLARIETRTVPARFQSRLEQLTNANLREKVRMGGEDVVTMNPEKVVDLISEGLYDLAGLDKATVARAKAEALETLQLLRDNGFDPIGVHRIHPSARTRVEYPHVSSYPHTPAQLKARSLEMSSTLKDIGISVSDEGLQFLTQKVNQTFADEFTRVYGKSRADLETELLPRAEARFKAHPTTPLKTHLENLISERYVPNPVGEVFASRHVNVGQVGGQSDVLVPRALANNFKRMYEPPLPKLTKVLDKPNAIFRSAVIPYSIRVLVNNLFGGGFMVAVESPTAFRHIFRQTRAALDAWGAARKGEAYLLEHQQPGTAGGGIGQAGPREMRGWGHEVTVNSPLPSRLAAVSNYSLGRSMRTWYEQARESRLASIPGKIADASYGINEFVDDLNRAMIFAEAKGKGLKKLGLTEPEAQAYANSITRRAFVAWDEMTPMERSVMRTVTPFYGFSSWAVRRVLSYPMDHPLRTEVLTALARTEQDDAGLGERFRDLLFLGDPRSNKPISAASLAGINPFASVPDLFTVQGFLGSTSPVIQTTLEALGVDIMRGGPMQYSELRYDPESGRLVASGKGLGWGTIGNFVPQFDALRAMSGHNEEFRQLLQSNPQAAGRMLAGSLGLPTYFRTVDTGSEVIKAELARFGSEENARREALKSGDFHTKYPALNAYLAQIEQLQRSGRLRAMTPAPSTSPGIPSVLVGGLTG